MPTTKKNIQFLDFQAPFLRRVQFFTFLLLVLLSSCSGKKGPAHPLLGTWSSVRPNIETTYVFDDKGTCVWIFNGITGKDSFKLNYEVIDTLSPKSIELKGFERGPLQGMVLFGIYEVFGDSMRLDFEPRDKLNPIHLKMFRPGETVIFLKGK